MCDIYWPFPGIYLLLIINLFANSIYDFPVTHSETSWTNVKPVISASSLQILNCCQKSPKSIRLLEFLFSKPFSSTQWHSSWFLLVSPGYIFSFLHFSFNSSRNWFRSLLQWILFISILTPGNISVKLVGMHSRKQTEKFRVGSWIQITSRNFESLWEIHLKAHSEEGKHTHTSNTGRKIVQGGRTSDSSALNSPLDKADFVTISPWASISHLTVHDVN